GLSGCDTLPSAGPTALEINAKAGSPSIVEHGSSTTVFDVVDVDQRSAQMVANFSTTTLHRRFGIGGAAKRVVIGVGDQLKVTIFEAGADGLFSTTESKQTSLEVVVQPDGTAAIPYVGTVKFAGQTLEQARQTILKSLSGKAVEPDVIVTSMSTSSRNVTVSGAVGHPSMVPMSLIGETITEVIAKAGGPSAQPYESYVTLVRGRQTGTALLKTVIENPSENIYVQPGDQIFVTKDPRTFTLLGETAKNNRIEFGSNDLNILEAVALGGGAAADRANAAGYFIFRYEEPEIVSDLLGATRFRELVGKGMKPNRDGQYPMVYRLDMTKPGNLIVGQTFPIKNRDVLYVSRHPAVDLDRFLQLIGRPIGTAYQFRRLAD
ncbi:polysaccharide biosynthesis/export family protein, partial [Shinella sp.]|uniref:polysaccharide biosynthesis/export family protein n=1 Tax=Shinella sp. TaxID=1870904 RepID=UPI0028A26B68